jgi:2,3-dihydroxyphenylpropionate 1,2-dioxygenase
LARIVGFVGVSHSPFWVLGEPAGEIGGAFVAAVEEARQRVEALQPDAIMVIGPDHFRNFFYDAMPPFCFGVGAVQGFGDYGTVKGELLSMPGLASDIRAGVAAAGFDPAASLAMGVDHGITQPYQALCPTMDIPLLPVMITAAGEARPTLQRCHDLGAAIGRAVEGAASDARIVVVASGGLSHWVRPVAPEDPRTDAEIRDYVVHGRPRAEAYSAMRDAGVAQRRAEGSESRVNAQWDRDVIAAFEAGDLAPLLAQSDQHIEAIAGNGALEVRCWVAAAAAWGGRVECLAYEPLPRWATGMACFSSVKG